MRHYFKVDTLIASDLCKLWFLSGFYTNQGLSCHSFWSIEFSKQNCDKKDSHCVTNKIFYWRKSIFDPDTHCCVTNSSVNNAEAFLGNIVTNNHRSLSAPRVKRWGVEDGWAAEGLGELWQRIARCNMRLSMFLHCGNATAAAAGSICMGKHNTSASRCVPTKEIYWNNRAPGCLSF